jgi:hypothetical protein
LLLSLLLSLIRATLPSFANVLTQRSDTIKTPTLPLLPSCLRPRSNGYSEITLNCPRLFLSRLTHVDRELSKPLVPGSARLTGSAPEYTRMSNSSLTLSLSLSKACSCQQNSLSMLHACRDCCAVVPRLLASYPREPKRKKIAAKPLFAQALPLFRYHDSVRLAVRNSDTRV